MSYDALARRDFLKLVFASASLAAFPTADGAQSPRASTGLIDVNVKLSRWPLRRWRLDDTGAPVSKLQRHGATEAGAGTFDGLLHKDIAAVNARLADECRRHGRGLLVPFGSINPKLPDWEEDLRRC